MQLRTTKSLALLTLLGCLRIQEYALPDEISDEQAVVIALLPIDEGRPLLYASSAGQLSIPIYAAEDHQIYLLAYEESLPELGLEVGPLEIPSPTENFRTVPQPSVQFTLDLNEDLWRISESLPERISGARIAQSSPKECLSKGGCITGDREAGETICQEPCLAPKVAPPEPNPPERPETPTVEVWCPEAWRDGQRCIPQNGAANFLDDLRAGNFPRCSSTGWPEGPFEGVPIYIRPGAMNGIGSIESPMGSIALALNVANPGDTLVLHSGVHEFAGVLDSELTIVGAGACPQGTSLVLQANVTGGPVSIQAVRIMPRSLQQAALVIQSGGVSMFQSLITGSGFGVETQSSEPFIGRDLALFGLDTAFKAVGADLDLQRVVVEDVELALEVSEESSLTLSEIFIGNSRSGITAQSSEGENQPQAEITRGIFSVNRRAISLESGQFNLTDIVFHQAQEELRKYSPLVRLIQTSSLTLQKATFSGAPGNRILVGNGGQAQLTDILIEDPPDTPFHKTSYGILIEEDAAASIRNLEIKHFAGRPFVMNSGAVALRSASIEGWSCQSTEAQENITPLISINGRKDATFQGSDLRLEGSSGCPPPVGIRIDDRSSGEIERLQIKKASVGVRVNARGPFVITDLMVEDLQHNPHHPFLGVDHLKGILNGSRWHIEVPRFQGVSFIGINSGESENMPTMSLDNLRIVASEEYIEEESKGIFLRANGAWEFRFVSITGLFTKGIELSGFVGKNFQQNFHLENIRIEFPEEAKQGTSGIQCLDCRGEFSELYISGFGIGIESATFRPLDLQNVLLRRNMLGLSSTQDFEIPPLSTIFEENVENFQCDQNEP